MKFMESYIAGGTLLVLLILAPPQPTARGENDARFVPNETLQKEFRKLYDADSEQELRQKFAQLEELSDGRADLVRQLLWFGSRATETREGMVPAVVIDSLGISEQEVIGVIAPYLGEENDEFRKEIEQLLRDLEPGLQPRRRLFKYLYAPIEANARQDVFPPAPLVQFIYRRNPGNSLHNMMRAYLRDDPVTQRPPIVWAEHVVQDAIWKKEHRFQDAYERAKPDAIQQLSLLASRDEWWVRLYVAEILRRHPEFGTPEMIDQLQKDRNELIHNALAAEEERSSAPQAATSGTGGPLKESPAPPRKANPDECDSK